MSSSIWRTGAASASWRCELELCRPSTSWSRCNGSCTTSSPTCTTWLDFTTSVLVDMEFVHEKSSLLGRGRNLLRHLREKGPSGDREVIRTRRGHRRDATCRPPPLQIHIELEFRSSLMDMMQQNRGEFIEAHFFSIGWCRLNIMPHNRGEFIGAQLFSIEWCRLHSGCRRIAVSALRHILFRFSDASDRT